MRMTEPSVSIRLSPYSPSRTGPPIVRTRTSIRPPSHLLSIPLNHLRKHPKFIKQMLHRQMPVQEFRGMILGKTAL